MVGHKNRDLLGRIFSHTWIHARLARDNKLRTSQLSSHTHNTQTVLGERNMDQIYKCINGGDSFINNNRISSIYADLTD